VIELSSVSYTYPDSPLPAVTDISLSIDKGQVLSLIGRNASGKSTLCRLAAGIINPQSGTVSIDGLESGDESAGGEIRRRVALLQQNPESQFVSVTVEREIASGPENLGFSAADTRRTVEELLAFFGLREVRTHHPHALSGGQMQKALLASLLAMKPAYLILDEPTSYLDPLERLLVGRELKRVCAELRTSVVWVTQFVAEALSCPRMAAMERGRLCFLGTPEEFVRSSEVRAELGIHDAQRLLKSGFTPETGLAPETHGGT
jgi:energy-coupling factor transport system ATP-binding protein